ncbi:MAG: phosphotransferase [Planctomycetota bacterium]|jgi:Ser/Thr protein kinase RdoA (MazF antagonist)
MPRGGAKFSSEELAKVLSHYGIGVIHQVQPLNAGSKRTPKMVIISEKGKFLLKRRSRGKDDFYRTAFAHSVQNHLGQKDFPVTVLVEASDEKNTILQLNNHIYELFEFVTGYRYDGSAEATIDAGRQLAKFHQYLADFASEWKPLKGGFHDSTKVRRHLKTIGAERPLNSNEDMRRVADFLMVLYNGSSVRVNELGFDSWPEQVVHGDWHPGNMLFEHGKITVVLDFDSVKISPPVIDLANGMLQFSIVGDRPNPVDWPGYLDQAKLIQFLNGYREVVKLDKYRLDSLLDLMIETMIAEAILPIVETGFFGNLKGLDFLKMIQRKVEWIHNNRQTLTKAVESET